MRATGDNFQPTLSLMVAKNMRLLGQRYATLTVVRSRKARQEGWANTFFFPNVIKVIKSS
jgi:hypothetical protein